MDIAFVRPSSQMIYRTVGPDVGLTNLSKACKMEGLTVKIIDLELGKLGRIEDQVELCVKRIQELNPLAVGVKLFTMDMHFGVKFSECLKQALPDVKLIAGGPHPSGIGKHVLNQLPYCDYAFQGEAEIGLPRLLENLSNGSSAFLDIPGLIYRDNGEIKANERAFTENLDKLGVPDYEEMPPNAYPITYTGETFIPVMTTRGCPFHCRYCGAHLVSGRKLRHRSPGLVIEELRLLKEKYGVDRFTIPDDNFVSDKAYAVETLNAMIESNLGLTWSYTGGVRLDRMDEDLIRLMEEAGCDSVHVGVESGSQRTLDAMNRQCKIETMIEKVNLIKNHSNMIITTYFIIGYPAETAEDIEETIKVAKALPIEATSFFLYVPLPGTEMWRSLVEQGKVPVDPPSWENYSLHGYKPSLSKVSTRKLEWLKFKAYFTFYFRWRIVKYHLSAINSPHHLYRILQRGFQVLLSK